MKNTLILTLIIYANTAFGQLFSFQMFFSDAVGNRDTITLGYDSAATDSIDSTFGEINIIATPLDTALDVRITNEWKNRFNFHQPGTFHTKRQIYYYECPMHSYSHVADIDISTKHWPVTATWNDTLFNDACRRGSAFSSFAVMWDVIGPSNLGRQVLHANHSVTFSSNLSHTYEPWFSYINITGDTIPVFWQVFGDSNILSIGIEELPRVADDIIVSPNPSADFTSIDMLGATNEVVSIEFYNSMGQIVLIANHTQHIDVSILKSGIYLVRLTTFSGLSSLIRFQKI